MNSYRFVLDTNNKQFMETRVEDMELSERTKNCLKRTHIDTIGNLINATDLASDGIIRPSNFSLRSPKIKNLGVKGQKEIMNRMLDVYINIISSENNGSQKLKEWTIKNWLLNNGNDAEKIDALASSRKLQALIDLM